MAWCTWRRGDYEIGTDPAKIDIAVVHGFLTHCYWARGIPEVVVRRSIENSICFGVYQIAAGEGTERIRVQVGFARIISDRATFSYIADVFILEPHRGVGLAKWMMECILQHPDLQRLRRWALVTADAHGLYEQFGFSRVRSPERWMELHDPDVYRKENES
jgi:GNAT superfamily N-acetyltransferase